MTLDEEDSPAALAVAPSPHAQDIDDDDVTSPADQNPPARSAHPDGPPPCTEVPLPARLEALLISTERPLTDGRLAALTGLSGRGALRAIAEALEQLNAEYERGGRSFRAVRVAGGWQLMTQPELAPLLERLHKERVESRLSQAALETLSIVAYRQPIMRAEIEAIRGVACGEVIRSLLERRLIRIAGRAEQLGRPLLYGTTPQFLRLFGLGALDDLPPVDEGPRVAAPAATPPPPSVEAPPSEDEDPGAGAGASAIVEFK